MRLIMLAALAWVLLVVPATVSSTRVLGLSRTYTSRSLLQDDKPITAEEAQNTMIQSLQKIKDGDKDERAQTVALQYIMLGCGGKTRKRNPDDVAADMINNVQNDPAYVDAGVADTWVEIIHEALGKVHNFPITPEECDKAYGTTSGSGSGRHLLNSALGVASSA